MLAAGGTTNRIITKSAPSTPGQSRYYSIIKLLRQIDVSKGLVLCSICSIVPIPACAGTHQSAFTAAKAEVRSENFREAERRQFPYVSCRRKLISGTLHSLKCAAGSSCGDVPSGNEEQGLISCKLRVNAIPLNIPSTVFQNGFDISLLTGRLSLTHALCTGTRCKLK